MYDDIECSCVFELHGMFYLLGSIREDINVRYWFAPDFFGEYHSFHDDVLLPSGNYAARFTGNLKESIHFSLIRYGNYIELSINGIVKLSLMDYTYSGSKIGIYSASSIISLQELTFKQLPLPEAEYASQEEEQKLPG